MSSSFTILFIIFVLVFLAMTGGVVFLIYYVIKKSTEKKSDDFIHNERAMMQNWVAEKRKSLVDWNGHDFTDIGCRMKYKSSKGMSRKLAGTLNNRKNKPIIAFQRIERGLRENGHVYASSTNYDIYFKLMDGAYEINYDGAPLGMIAKSGQIYNANGDEIGYSKHPISTEINIPFYSHRTGAKYYDFNINNRLLASIEVAPNINNLPKLQTTIGSSNENIGHQLVRLEDRNYTKDEEKWLNAMAILEAVVHGYWFV